MSGLQNVIGSLGGRKFLVAILGVVAVALQSKFGISPEQVQWIGGIVISFVLGQGLADGLSKGVTSTAGSEPIQPPVEDKPLP